MTNNNYSTHLNNYKESEALDQLLKSAISLIDKVAKSFESDSDSDENYEFTINVDGTQTAFYAGGPQIEALYAFIEHIAAENFYDVDIDGGTVKG